MAKIIPQSPPPLSRVKWSAPKFNSELSLAVPNYSEHALFRHASLSRSAAFKCKFTSKRKEENIKMPHRNLDQITQVFFLPLVA